MAGGSQSSWVFQSDNPMWFSPAAAAVLAVNVWERGDVPTCSQVRPEISEATAALVDVPQPGLVTVVGSAAGPPGVHGRCEAREEEEGRHQTTQHGCTPRYTRRQTDSTKNAGIAPISRTTTTNLRAFTTLQKPPPHQIPQTSILLHFVCAWGWD